MLDSETEIMLRYDSDETDQDTLTDYVTETLQHVDWAEVER